MIRHEIEIKPNANLSDSERLIESCCKNENLIRKMKGTLKNYPGSVHWHFTKDDQKGTLEITLWRKMRRVWISIQPRREGPWMKETVLRLKKEIEIKLND